MNFNQLQDLLKYYLYSYKGFSDEDYEILTDSKNPRQFTIDKIKEGFPVEIRMGGTNGRHAMIAYDYDEKADEIFVHPGRLDYPTHVAISSLDYSGMQRQLFRKRSMPVPTTIFIRKNIIETSIIPVNLIFIRFIINIPINLAMKIILR